MSELKRKKSRFQRRRNRSKGLSKQLVDRFRLCVYRSNRHIEAQIINDRDGKTIVSASSNNQSLKKNIKSAESKSKCAEIVGKALAERAKESKITNVVFDRNGFPFHGRVKSLADGARKGGLVF
jgi:large subunit ribosomal protein L18